MTQAKKSQEKHTYYAEERKREIMRILSEQHTISIPILCDRFGTSPVTIRNDLNELQQAGFLKRTHGGAILSRQVGEEKLFAKEIAHQKEKEALAEYAISLINDGDTILLDTGTTTGALAKLLSRRNNLSIIVNDIQIAAYLERETQATIMMLGGILRRGMHCTVGPAASQMLSLLKVDKAFMGTNGLTLEGLSTPDVYQAEIKQKMLQIANRVILMADSSKIGNYSFQQFATTQDYDTLLTDENADADFVAKLREQGITVVLL